MMYGIQRRRWILPFSRLSMVCAMLFGGCVTRERTPITPTVEDDVVLRTNVDKPIATTRDTIKLEITVSHPESLEVPLPDVGAEIAGLRITDFGSLPPVTRMHRRTVTRWYKLQADVPGSYVIPAFTVSYQDGNGTTKTRKSAQIFLSIQAQTNADGEQQALRDIKSVEAIPFNARKLVTNVLIGIGIFTAMALILLWLIRRFRQKKNIDAVPPHETALAELNHLRQERLLESGRYKTHYFKLSEIIRTYIENRYGFPASDRTREEILSHIDDLPIDREELKTFIGEFLFETDLVKFTQAIPDLQGANVLMDRSTYFVDQTKPPLESDSNGDTITEERRRIIQ